MTRTLEFVNGEIKKGLSEWSSFEKEAFAIVYAKARLDYYIACANTPIHTDRNN